MPSTSKQIVLLFLAVALGGCELYEADVQRTRALLNPVPRRSAYWRPNLTKDVKFLSEPAGAKIVIDNELIGVTPCTYALTLRGGEFGYRYTSYLIEAHPDKLHTLTGLASGHVHERLIQLDDPGSFPANVWFDMSLEPVPMGVTVDLGR